MSNLDRLDELRAQLPHDGTPQDVEEFRDALQRLYPSLAKTARHAEELASVVDKINEAVLFGWIDDLRGTPAEIDYVELGTRGAEA